MESLKISLCKYGQLFFDKVAKIIQQGKDSPFNKCWIPTRKQILDSYLTTYKELTWNGPCTMDRRAWRAIFHGVAKSGTGLKWLSMHTLTMHLNVNIGGNLHCLELGK